MVGARFRPLAAVVLAAAALVAGCGGDEDADEPQQGEPPSAATTAATTNSLTPAQQRAEARAVREYNARRRAAERARVRAARFKPSQVALKVVTKENLGGQLQVMFIAAGPRGDHGDRAFECLEHYLGGPQQSVYCMAFPSRAAYRHARVDPATGGLKRLCWSARAGVALSGDSTAGLNDQAIADAEGCPR